MVTQLPRRVETTTPTSPPTKSSASVSLHRVKPNGNIYLIGFSGTGKSLSGIRAAELLKLPVR